MCSAGTWSTEKTIGIYTDGDHGKVLAAFSFSVSNFPDGAFSYDRPIDDPMATACDHYNHMYFHGNFSQDFYDNFLTSVTNMNDNCYVSDTSTVAGKSVQEVKGLGWHVLQIPPSWLVRT